MNNIHHINLIEPVIQPDAYRMIVRRARAAGIWTRIGNHPFRATGITEYLKNGAELEIAQAMAPVLANVISLPLASQPMLPLRCPRLVPQVVRFPATAVVWKLVQIALACSAQAVRVIVGACDAVPVLLIYGAPVPRLHAGG